MHSARSKSFVVSASAGLMLVWIMLCASARTLAEPSPAAGLERMRAVPGAGDPRFALPVAVGLGMVLSLFALLAWVRRARRRALRRWQARELHDDPAHDDALDEELSRAGEGSPTQQSRRVDSAHDPVLRVR
jgi:hypothetical protein